MDQNALIKKHLLQLKTDWNHDTDSSLLDTLDAENISTFPQSGIMLKPGDRFFLILDTHEHFKFNYTPKTQVNISKTEISTTLF